MGYFDVIGEGWPYITEKPLKIWGAALLPMLKLVFYIPPNRVHDKISHFQKRIFDAFGHETSLDWHSEAVNFKR